MVDAVVLTWRVSSMPAEDSIDSSSIGLLAMLRPGEIAGSTLASQVASQLDAAIAMGILAKGTRLPSEPELAAALGVSQMTLRSALATLRTRGLIATVRGRGGGSVVRGRAEPLESAIRGRLLTTGADELRDLGDLYSAVTAAAAGLAAGRADENDILGLEELATLLSAATTAGEFWRLASRFQVKTGMAAQSGRLTAAILRVQIDLAGLRSNAIDRESLAAGFPHSRIVESIRDGDERAAREAAAQQCDAEIQALINCRLQLLLEPDG